MPWGEIVTFSLEQWILNLENRNIWYLLNLNFSLLKKPYNQGQYKDHLASVSDQERQVLRAIIGQKTWQSPTGKSLYTGTGYG